MRKLLMLCAASVVSAGLCAQDGAQGKAQSAMTSSFDDKSILKERPLLDTTPVTNPAQFPYDETVPKGAIVLKGLTDDWGYTVDIHTDVVYTERRGQNWKIPLKMHILEPQAMGRGNGSPQKRPCIAYIQGSAFHDQWLWNYISRHIRLAERGFVVAIIQYRASDVAPFPAQMQDAKTAIRFLRLNAAKYNIDSDRIAVAGDSSGGHTALMAGFTGDNEPDTDEYSSVSAAVSCIIDLNGPTVFSLMNRWPSIQDHHSPDSPEGYEIGRKDVLENPDIADTTTVMNYLSPDRPTPPTLIIHGGRDMLVPFSQGCMLYEYMKSMDKDVTMFKIDEASHGFLGFNNDTIIGIMANFLNTHM